MMWYWGNGAHWWAMLFGVVVMVAFWGVIVWAIWSFVTGADRRSEQTARTDDARRILDERLARGEIAPEEYERLRTLIGNDVRSASSTNAHTAVGTGGQ